MEWKFEQLEGPSADRKTLRLSDYYAPFGRPRKDPIMREVIRSRVQTTRYPGSDKQTRHAFGTNWEPIELKGRWMTKAGGAKAQDFAQAWVEFIKDERTFRLSWGSILSWTAFMEEIELAHESEHEIAWRMKIHLDQRDDSARRSPSTILLAVKIADNIAFIQSWVNTAIAQKVQDFPEMSPDFFDTLNNLASTLSFPSRVLANLAGELDSFEKKSFATLQHFRGAVSQMRTAFSQMREVVVNAQVDEAILVRTAESDLKWVTFQSELDDGAVDILENLSQLDRAAELQQRSEVDKFVTAQEGDSWESISTRATGSPVKANDIRSLNGVRYGEKPVPGESYFVQ